MANLFSFLTGSKKAARPLPADFHSHLIPGIDDGVPTAEEAFRVIDRLLERGYTKLITTPHIMTDYFGNTSSSVTEAYQAFLPVLREAGYDLSFDIAAEYYLDENLYQQALRKEKFLTFGDRYLLFETNPISEPMMLKEFIFQLTTQGYKPIIAHPERYQFMTPEKAQDLRDRGVLLQLNMLSLIGYYGPPIQKLAVKLIDSGMVDALGSDCHHIDHAKLLEKVQATSAYSRAVELPLLNYRL
ncbi:MAG: capsular biosynthesis protein [Bacteroidetes bacterium]|nr:capsular biosynthesis protein [Bacteroidota bacterium]